MDRLQALIDILDDTHQVYKRENDKIRVDLGSMLSIVIYYDYTAKQFIFSYNLIAQMVGVFGAITTSVYSIGSGAYSWGSLSVSTSVCILLSIVVTEIRMQSLKSLVLSRLETSI